MEIKVISNSGLTEFEKELQKAIDNGYAIVPGTFTVATAYDRMYRHILVQRPKKNG